MTRFSVIADVSSDNLAAVRPVLLHMIEGATVTNTADGLRAQGIMDGTEVRDVNRRLLSALRQAEKKTRLRAEWTADGQVHRFLDYVPKSTRPVGLPGLSRYQHASRNIRSCRNGVKLSLHGCKIAAWRDQGSR